MHSLFLMHAESHGGLGCIWAVFLTLPLSPETGALSSAVIIALDIDYLPKREWEYIWILKQALFPPSCWCADTSDLSGKKYISSDRERSRRGWSFPPWGSLWGCRRAGWPCTEPSRFRACVWSCHTCTGKCQDHWDQRLFAFLPNAIASFLGSSQWRAKSIYEPSDFCGMRKLFPPLLQAEGLHMAS